MRAPVLTARADAITPTADKCLNQRANVIQLNGYDYHQEMSSRAVYAYARYCQPPLATARLEYLTLALDMHIVGTSI